MNRFTYLLGVACIAMSACGGTSSDAGGAGAELEPFKSFSYDTGAVPTGSPVTLDLKASAAGKLTLSNAGSMAVDAHVTMLGTMVSTVPGFTYDGPLMGAPNLDIAIKGSTTFPANAVGQKTTLTAPITPSDLIDLPLATLLGLPGITGNLDLKVTGGTFTADFTGLCNNDGKYSGTIATGGNIMLAGTLSTAVLGIDKSFDIPAITMPLPMLTQVISFATSADPGAVGCAGPDAGGDMGNGDLASGDGSSQTGDGGTTMTGGCDGLCADTILPNANYQISIRVIDETTASGLGVGVCSGEDAPDPYVTLTAMDDNSTMVTGSSGRCDTVKICDLSEADGLVRENQFGGPADSTNAPINIAGSELIAGTVKISVWDFDVSASDLVGEGTLPAMTQLGSGIVMAGPYSSAASCPEAAIPIQFEVKPHF